MFENEAARSAKAAPKAKRQVARSPKASTTTKPTSRTGAATAPAAEWLQDDIHERVRQRAYELWESEGRPAGREYDHWLQAEREVASTPRRRAA